jgi:hypothetical protein
VQTAEPLPRQSPLAYSAMDGHRPASSSAHRASRPSWRRILRRPSVPRAQSCTQIGRFPIENPRGQKIAMHPGQSRSGTPKAPQRLLQQSGTEWVPRPWRRRQHDGDSKASLGALAGQRRRATEYGQGVRLPANAIANSKPSLGVHGAAVKSRHTVAAISGVVLSPQCPRGSSHQISLTASG